MTSPKTLSRALLAAVVPDVKARIAELDHKTIQESQCFERLAQKFPDLPTSIILHSIDEFRLKDNWWDKRESEFEDGPMRSTLASVAKRFPDVPSDILMEQADQSREDLEEAWWHALEESMEMELTTRW